MRTVLTALLLFAATGAPGRAGVIDTEAGRMEITPVLGGLSEPWAIGFLPDGGFLVTERDGRLLLTAQGRTQSVAGVPQVWAAGQGGLLDVMVPRDFATTREVWLTYSAPVDGGAATAAGRGRLSDDDLRLTGFETLFLGEPSAEARHFGSRLVEAADGSLYLTTGDRGTGPDGLEAQDPGSTLGKVIHLSRDGAPLADIPGWAPGVISIGHRNLQGAALGLDGALYTVDHGAQGGDEVNRIEPGRNYGWPVITYGINYNGATIGEGRAKDGMEQPLHYWDPSIAPSGLLIYSGKLIPGWAGDIFTGSLKSDFISRLDPDSAAATGYAEERIVAPETGRVRDVVEAPDGAIWFLSVNDGAVYRIAPED